MEKQLDLAEKSIKAYLKDKSYPKDIDISLKKAHLGVMVKVILDGKLKGFAGSINPTRQSEGLDIIYETIKAAFNSYKFPPITRENLDKVKVEVYEFYDLKRIMSLEDLGDFDGVSLAFAGRNYIFFKKDYESLQKMGEAMVKEANLDSFNIFILTKFRANIYKN